MGFNGADPFNYQNYFDANHFLPVFFVTVACGILSGFHSTQTAIITRTMKSERQGRTTFYWMMILEGFIAMVWAAGAMGAYNLGLQEANASLATATIGVVCKDILGPVGGIIALLGVIILPVTSGDTALRALRLTVSESFHMDQSNNGKRLTLAVPIFVLVAAIIVWAKFNSDGFNTLWRYFAWSNQTLSLFAFLAISVWMFENKKSKFVWIPLIPRCLVHLHLRHLHRQRSDRLPHSLDPRLRHRRLRCYCLCGSHRLLWQEARRPSGQSLSPGIKRVHSFDSSKDTGPPQSAAGRCPFLHPRLTTFPQDRPADPPEGVTDPSSSEGQAQLRTKAGDPGGPSYAAAWVRLRIILLSVPAGYTAAG